MWHSTSSSLASKAILALCTVFSLLISGCTTTEKPSLQTNQSKQAERPDQSALNKVNIPTQCRAKVLIPAKFSDAKRQLRVFEGSPTFVNEPAEIRWAEVRYQIAPARYPVETVPAQYREVTEQVKTIRSRIEVIGKSAQYKILKKPVTLQEAYIRWKEGCLPSGDKPEQCFERIPAQQKVFDQKIVDIPARTVQQAIPEKTIEFTRKILVSRGQGTGKPIPAQYKTIKVGTVTKPWRLQANFQPSRHEYVPIKVKQRQESIRELPVFCYQRAEKAQMIAIQQQLRQNDYKVSMTGLADQQTLTALIQFQQSHDLPIGAITLQTLRKLGL